MYTTSHLILPKLNQNKPSDFQNCLHTNGRLAKLVHFKNKTNKKKKCRTTKEKVNMDIHNNINNI